MTILISACSLLCTIAVTFGILRLAETTSHRVQAQLAADAAALAAVATSVPGRGGDPPSIAARYASLNGARLVDCWCDPGATAVQVEVAVGKMHARARAVFDPELLRPAMPDL
ncbi:MAG TPA: hypothetical protein VG408_07870 [Actinomycetota bacterium]|nr:hypothetical protein [Actinomycetota bacterium]